MHTPLSRVAEVRISGPLAPYLSGFKSALADSGYTPLSTVNQMRLMGHLSRWLESKRVCVSDLTTERVEEFLAARRADGYTALLSRQGLTPLLNFLSTRGKLPAAPLSAPKTGTDLVLASFHRYLLQERGLAPSTAAAYVTRTGRFLTGCADDGDLSKITAGDVTRAVLDESTTRSVGSVQFFVVALRSFLRFCCVQGLVEVDLSGAALRMTGRRYTCLPRGIGRAEATALLSSCDRRRTVGPRDHAVLMTLLRLGLCAGEVATLTLDDIDWDAAQIVVHGKGRRDESLPLPVEVGEAIAAYLQRGRPVTTRREVFLTVTAPLAGLKRGSVSLIVRRACLRAGITPIGAHRLRHTVACEMLAAGAPLPEIGQLLRHHDMSSTAIYAKVDLNQLHSLALPWPGAADR
jgi:site-specific recombinase XerD